MGIGLRLYIDLPQYLRHTFINWGCPPDSWPLKGILAFIQEVTARLGAEAQHRVFCCCVLMKPVYAEATGHVQCYVLHKQVLDFTPRLAPIV